MSDPCDNMSVGSGSPATETTRGRRQEADTPSADDLVARAIAAAHQGQHVQACTLLDQALHMDPYHVEALLWRGGLGKPQEAVVYLERAYSLAPDDDRVRDGLAWARQRAGLSTQESASPILMEGGVAQPTDATCTARPETLPAAQSSPQRSRSRLAAAIRPGLAAVLAAILLVGLAVTVTLAQFGGGGEAAPVESTPVDAPADALIPPVTNTPSALPTQPTTQPTIPLIVLPTPSPTPSPTPTGPSPLDLAWKAEDWPQVVGLVQEMLKAAPKDAELIEKLFAAHYNYAMYLLRNDRPAEALAELDLALTVNVGDPRALAQRKVVQLHVQAANALGAGDYAAAITPLRALYEQNPSDALIKNRLYQAYIGHAAALEKGGREADAYAAYEKAAKLNAQGAEAQAGLARLKKPTPTPTPTPRPATGKKIEVDIAKQQVIVWENGKVLWRFKASTGKAPYLTRTGNFKIQSKMLNAYSSAMLWGMPYWMGIYYAGKWENGFHGMARVGKSQAVLPTSVLGRPATHGCIMLSDKDAKTLYEWAELGTPVWIH